MATLDLSRASSGFDMTAANLVTFGSVVGTPTATSWSYLTPAGNRVTVTGTSMQFDASGRPTAGSVTAVAVDVANDGDADIAFTGLSEAPSRSGSRSARAARTPSGGCCSKATT